MSSDIKQLSLICFTRIIDRLNSVEHIKNKNTTYFIHMKRAFIFSNKLMLSSMALYIHSIFPNLFESYASDKIKEISKEI